MHALARAGRRVDSVSQNLARSFSIETQVTQPFRGFECDFACRRGDGILTQRHIGARTPTALDHPGFLERAIRRSDGVHREAKLGCECSGRRQPLAGFQTARSNALHDDIVELTERRRGQRGIDRNTERHTLTVRQEEKGGEAATRIAACALE